MKIKGLNNRGNRHHWDNDNSDFIEIWKEDYDRMTYEEQLMFHAYFVPDRYRLIMTWHQKKLDLMYLVLKSYRDSKSKAAIKKREKLLYSIHHEEVMLQYFKAREPFIARYAKTAKGMLDRIR